MSKVLLNQEETKEIPEGGPGRRKKELMGFVLVWFGSLLTVEVHQAMQG